MTEKKKSGIRVEIENLGGIDYREEKIQTGINVLSGVNATNRTSFLQALATGLGANSEEMRARVKRDCDEGQIRLEIAGEQYNRSVKHSGGGADVVTGSGYLTDERDIQSAELFAWMFSSNKVRQAVRDKKGGLRDLAMEPVDMEAIKKREQDLKDRRSDIEDELEEIKNKKERKVEIAANIRELEEEKESIEERIRETEKKIEQADRGVKEAKEEKGDREQQIDTLEKRRNKLNEELQSNRRIIRDTKDSLELARKELDEVREALASSREELDGLDVDKGVVVEKRRELQSELEQKRSTRNALEDVISFNKEALEDKVSEIGEQLSSGTTRGSGVELLDSELGDEGTDSDVRFVDCWTCGTSTKVGTLREQLDFLRSQKQEVATEIESLTSEIEELTKKEGQINDLRSRVSDLEGRENNLEERIQRYNSKIEAKEKQVQEKEAEVEEIKGELSAIKKESESEVISLSIEIGEYREQLNSRDRDLEDAREKLEDIEQAESAEDELRSELEKVKHDIVDVREKVENIEDEIVERFNKHMEELVRLLEYENIARIWINKREQSGGRGHSKQTVFDLEVVRENSEGQAYNDSLETLSESEREVVGVAFALAGYLAHDVYETMPLLLFDSVEMIDGERLKRLFSYLSESSEYIVAALLENDAQIVGAEATSMVDFGQFEPAD